MNKSVSGISLIEVTIAMGVASMVSLTVAQTMYYAQKATTANSLRQELTEQTNMLVSYLGSPLCANMFNQNNINLAALTSTSTSINVEIDSPSSSSGTPLFKTGSMVPNSTAWKVESVLLKKVNTISSYVNPSDNNQVTSMAATVNIIFSEQRPAPGGTTIQGIKVAKVYPFVFTMKKPPTAGTHYKMMNCSAASASTDTGWNDLADPRICQRYTGLTSFCPGGYYLIGIDTPNNKVVCCKVMK